MASGAARRGRKPGDRRDEWRRSPVIALAAGLACLIGAGLISFNWWRRRIDALGRLRSFPSVSLLLLVALGVAFLTPWVLRARLQARLAAAASEIVGAPVRVRCQSFGGAFVDAGAELGYVRFDEFGRAEPETLLKRDQCRDLAAYLRSDKTAPSREQVVAVHTLTHEAVHMMGVQDERETECRAVQLDYQLAVELGAAEAAARSLAQTYWLSIYPLMPPEYRSDECGPGGAFDLRLPHAPWTET